ncbi:hypothetical protein [Nonomuraea sp. NPDC049709]|uniref:hypothetical protein n=1 Tax=Nonomuraea sp. NPDC049709 TaxID=3154736 RepID=UPI0034439D15
MTNPVCPIRLTTPVSLREDGADLVQIRALLGGQEIAGHARDLRHTFANIQHQGVYQSICRQWSAVVHGAGRGVKPQVG